MHALTLGTKLSGSVSAPDARLSVTLRAALDPANARFDRAPNAATGPVSRTAVVDRGLEFENATRPAVNRDAQITTARTVPNGLSIAAADEWFTAEELDARAEPLTPPKLVYPLELSRTRTPGRVRLALFVDELGVVRKVHIVTSTPERLFDSAAVQAWQDIRFSPATKGGNAVKSKKILDVDFIPD